MLDERRQLNSNLLTGTIPVELSTMTSITELRLYSNLLTGTIPNDHTQEL